MKPHILFVDDEAPMREMLSLYFGKCGYEVSKATNSAEALRLAAGGAFQLAILDVNLAGENGLELLETLKARHPAMPILMFTGLSTKGDLLAQALARGADGLISKTESLHYLLGEVQRFVPAPPE